MLLAPVVVNYAGLGSMNLVIFVPLPLAFGPLLDGTEAAPSSKE